jgi:hypothetical protein
MRIGNGVSMEEKIRKSLRRLKQPIKEFERLKKKLDELEFKLEKFSAKVKRVKIQGSTREKIEKLTGVSKSNRPERQMCLGCLYKTPTRGLRVCPFCDLVFDGKGWDGIELHWRARHEHIMTYAKFWDSLCTAHRGLGPNPPKRARAPKPTRRVR